MNIRGFIKFTFYLFVTLFFTGALTAYFMGIMPTSVGIHDKVYKSANVAMDGYDLVEYLYGKKAMKGDVRFNYKYAEQNWFFSSTKNMKRFKKKPKKFIPQFGGYCTYTISQGFTYPPDPKQWYYNNGRLYFFKDQETKKLALKNWKDVLANANMHWK